MRGADQGPSGDGATRYSRTRVAQRFSINHTPNPGSGVTEKLPWQSSALASTTGRPASAVVQIGRPPAAKPPKNAHFDGVNSESSGAARSMTASLFMRANIKTLRGVGQPRPRPTSLVATTRGTTLAFVLAPPPGRAAPGKPAAVANERPSSCETPSTVPCVVVKKTTIASPVLSPVMGTR